MSIRTRQIISFSFFLVLLIAFAPILFQINGDIRMFLKQFSSGICNFKIERSIEIFSSHTLLCARCVGIYIAAMLFFIKPVIVKNKYIIILISFTIIDKVMEWTIGFTNLHLRLINGFFLGFALSGFVYHLREKMRATKA